MGAQSFSIYFVSVMLVLLKEKKASGAVAPEENKLC